MSDNNIISPSTNPKYWYSFPCSVNSDNVGKFIDFVLGKVHSDISPEFTLYLSSLGGDMDSAIRFYDFIKALNLKINTVGYGQVESAAIMLFLCGQKRFVHKDCRLRLHAPRYSGPEQLQVISVHQEVTTLLQKLDERYFEIIAKETSKKNSEIRKVYNKGKILVGKEAVDFGFATETVNKLPIFK